MRKTLRLPMNVSEYNMKKKECNYKVLAIMTLYSNYDYKEFVEGSDAETHRYLYRDKVIECTEEIEKLSKYKMTTMLRYMKKLSSLEGNLVEAVKTDEGKIIYKINYQSGEIVYDEEGNPTVRHGAFVLIEEEILKYLTHATNSDVIKVYLLIRTLCEHETRRTHGKIKEKRITRKFIAEHIGWSTASSHSLDIISNDIIACLIGSHLIKRRRVRQNKNGNLTDYYYYTVCSVEEFLAWKKTV